MFVSCITADVCVELGRSVYMNFNLENVNELTEFLDGLVLSSEEPLGPKDSQIASSGGGLLLSTFGFSTSAMFVQLEAPPVLGKPKLLGSVVGIEAKASLKPDLQGMPSKFLVCSWLVAYSLQLCNTVRFISCIILENLFCEWVMQICHQYFEDPLYNLLGAFTKHA